MKKFLIAISFFSFCILLPPCLDAQIKNVPFGKYLKHTTEKQIHLNERLQYKTNSKLLNVSLFYGDNYLRAEIPENNAELLIQIIDDGQSVVYSENIDKSQYEWLLDIQSLIPGKTYTIKFIPPSGSYLFGHFVK